MNFNIKVTNIIETDVVVIGGGTSGVFAAISAARNGVKAVLVEKNSTLGGTVTTAGVNFPGLFYAWGKQIIGGPCWEAIEKTIMLDGAKLPSFQYKPEKHFHEQILLNKFAYRAVLFDMCKDSGVTLITNAMLSNVHETDDKINLLITTKDRLCCIKAKVAIDATGDANLSVMAGYETKKSSIQQPATPQNHISGYDLEQVDEKMLYNKFSKANFPNYLTAEKLFEFLKIEKIDVHIPCFDADTSFGKTKLEYDSINMLNKIFVFLKGIKGLQNLKIDYFADETGVRETNRIVGETTLSAEDYINGKLFDDAICYAFYPIDLHVMDGIKQQFFAEGKVGTIPFSALIPKGAKRVLVAGRCISSDTDSNSAIRVQAPCMATGQAVGCAAALCVKNNSFVKDVNYKELCDCLEKIGAIVPK